MTSRTHTLSKTCVIPGEKQVILSPSHVLRTAVAGRPHVLSVGQQKAERNR